VALLVSLGRQTPLRRTPGPSRRTPLARTSSIARSQRIASTPPERDWRAARAKVEHEGRCRVCGAKPGRGVSLQAAHTIGRAHDKPRSVSGVLGIPEGPLWVDPLDVVPLCAGCHAAFDGRRLDLLPFLTLDEQAAAVRHVGIVSALRRLTGSTI
jgi:hypothetical protein